MTMPPETAGKKSGGIGLDASVLATVDFQRAIRRVLKDIQHDFVPAPHLTAVFRACASDLEADIRSMLAAGTYRPQLPIVVEVPKANGFTRPGAILWPYDRVVYQATADILGPIAEAETDRERVASYKLLDPDPDDVMFDDLSASIGRMNDSLREMCSDEFPFVLKADVANYFERIYQHILVNLFGSTSAPRPLLKWLEELLKAFSDNDSHGIIQGVFPSDLLGNFYLCPIDADFAIRGTPSIRNVDDMYAFYRSEAAARRGRTHLIHQLRKVGLNLNEMKSKILPCEHAIREETALDRQVREALDSLLGVDFEWGIYGMFELGESGEEGSDEEDDEDVELATDDESIAVNEEFYEVLVLFGLLDNEDVSDSDQDRILRVCLPAFASLKLDFVSALKPFLHAKPHLARILGNYLGAMAALENEGAIGALEDMFTNSQDLGDSRALWPANALIASPKCANSTVALALARLRDTAVPAPLRALCALIVARHGSAAQRNILRHHYEDEAADYVRAAILYGTRFLPKEERQHCLTSWGSHSVINGLIARAVRQGY